MSAGPPADRPLTPERIRRSLGQRIPGEISELLFAAVEFRCTARQVSVLVPNALWQQVFETYAASALDPLLGDRRMRVRLLSGDGARAVDGSQQATFAKFLADPGNQFALSSCRRILSAPGTEHNPLYLYGPHGCGKTHLLQSVAAEYRNLLGEEAVVFLDGPGFIASGAREMAKEGGSRLRDRVAEATLICFDRVDDLSGRHLAQEELYLLLNRCLEEGRQLVLTALSNPRQIPELEDRLTTRLGWGLTVGLDLPLLETRFELLRNLTGPIIDAYGHEEIVGAIEARAPDMHQVVQLAGRLRAGERLDRTDASVDRIIAVVAEHYDLRPADIAGKRRDRQTVRARQTALLLSRRLTSFSLSALGGMVGGRDHSTVLYSLEQAGTRLREDQDYARIVRQLTQAVLG